jgi:hypothetical protein
MSLRLETECNSRVFPGINAAELLILSRAAGKFQAVSIEIYLNTNSKYVSEKMPSNLIAEFTRGPQNDYMRHNPPRAVGRIGTRAGFSQNTYPLLVGGRNFSTQTFPARRRQVSCGLRFLVVAASC